MGRQALPVTFPGIKSDVGSDWSTRLWWLSSRRASSERVSDQPPPGREKSAPWCLDPPNVWLVVSWAIFSLATSNHRNYLSYQMWNQVPLCQLDISSQHQWCVLLSNWVLKPWDKYVSGTCIQTSTGKIYVPDFILYLCKCQVGPLRLWSFAWYIFSSQGTLHREWVYRPGVS